MDVDVPSACDTITDPSAPLALRLQGSLLFGVSRVFSQQCDYVLTDMQSLRDKMRGIKMLLKELEIDPDVATMRPEQLNLQIDPGFNIDLDLGFDLSAFDLNDSSTDELSSLLSPRTSASSCTSFNDGELGLGEALPLQGASSSEGGFEGFDLNGGGYFDDRQAQQQTTQPQDLLLDQPAAIAIDDSMQITEDGEVVFRADVATNAHSQEELDFTQAEPQIDDFELGLDLGEDLAYEQIDTAQQQDGSQWDPNDIEEQPIVLDQPSPKSSPTINQSEANSIFVSPEEDDEAANDSGEEVVEVGGAAPQRKKAAKIAPIDNLTELPNSTLGEWDTRYLELMEDAHKEHASKISVAQAKRNAAYWVLDQGIGGVSADFRGDIKEHPLAIFSGEALLGMLGQPEPRAAGRKRSSSAVAEAEGRRVRSRSEEGAVIDQDDFQPGNDDGEQLNNEEEPEPEMGREQEAPLSNGPEQFPWNDYASSHHGSRQGSIRPPMSIAGISSTGGVAPIDFMPSSLGSKRISRLIQESPLDRRRILRQSSLAGSATRAGTEAGNTLGEDDFDLGLDLDETVELDEQFADDLQDVEFETFGPAAPALASTQEAADSQWLTATLEQEAYNFLAFLATTIEGKQADGEEEESVTFEELLAPERNSHIVAAQGLLHVLSLATKGFIEVLQEEPFGSIEMGITKAAAGSEVEVA